MHGRFEEAPSRLLKCAWISAFRGGARARGDGYRWFWPLV